MSRGFDVTVGEQQAINAHWQSIVEYYVIDEEIIYDFEEKLKNGISGEDIGFYYEFVQERSFEKINEVYPKIGGNAQLIWQQHITETGEKDLDSKQKSFRTKVMEHIVSRKERDQMLEFIGKKNFVLIDRKKDLYALSTQGMKKREKWIQKAAR